MVRERKILLGDRDPYYKVSGFISGLEALALDDNKNEYKLPETLTSEQALAIARYALVHSVQRLTPFRSPTQAEATSQRDDAENELRNVFGNVDLAVAGIKEAMKISREFIEAAKKHAEKNAELIRRYSSSK